MEDRLNELPKGWVRTHVGEIYDIVGGGTPSTKVDKYWEGDIPWITSADIVGLKDIRPRKYINREAIQNSATNLVPTGSLIVVTRVGLGKIALTKTPLCFSQDSQALIGIDSQPYPDYSLYYLSQTVQIFKYRHRGTTIAGVTKSQLSELPFFLPPLPEQHRIVAKIEELFTRLDAGIEALKKIKAQLKRYRQAVLKYAFEGRLTNKILVKGQFPDGWKLFPIGKVIKTIDGDRGPNYPKKNEFSEKGHCLFLSTKNVREGRFVFEENIFISKEKDEILRAGKLQLNDVVITTRGTLGNVALYDDRVPFKNVRINSGMLILRVINPMLNDYYLMKFVSSSLFIKQLKEKQSGTAQPQIPANVLREIELPIPPTLEEQEDIVAEIESRFSIADNMEKVAEQSLKQSDRLRQSILRRAFEGKLVPQDPTDEPAEKLLKRIKEEKTKQKAENWKEKKDRNKNSNQMELI